MNTPSNLEAAVELCGLTKRFGAVDAVHNLTFRLPRGTVYGFLGPNGAGKSTTLKMLIGALRPDAGHALVLGLDSRTSITEIKRRVGYVPEVHSIHRWMRVNEAVRFCRRIFRTWNDRRCEELLKMFRLEERKRVKQLSKGMLTKLSLVLALSHDPEVLILDEPSAGLDPMAREEFLDCLLQTVCDEEHTVIFSSHTLSDVHRLADRIGILHEGRLLVDQPIEDLLRGVKRVRAVLQDGRAPLSRPEGTIYERRGQRDWWLTVNGFRDDTLSQLRATNPIENVEVFEIGLEEIFKDFIRGVSLETVKEVGVLPEVSP